MVSKYNLLEIIKVILEKSEYLPLAALKCCFVNKTMIFGEAICPFDLIFFKVFLHSDWFNSLRQIMRLYEKTINHHFHPILWKMLLCLQSKIAVVPGNANNTFYAHVIGCFFCQNSHKT